MTGTRSVPARRRVRRAVVGGVLTGRLLAVLLLVGCVVLLVGFLEGEQYRVRTVIVQGNRIAFAEAVVRESGVLGMSVFRVDTQAVAERLVQHPAIARATVRAYYPDTVTIEVVEREPASVWVTRDGSWLVDREGLVIGRGDREGIPHLVCDDGMVLQAGSSVPRTVVQALPELLARYGDRLARIEYRAADRLVLVFRGGERVVLGDAERLAEQLAVLDAILARGDTWLHLDVRDPERPVQWRIQQ